MKASLSPWAFALALLLVGSYALFALRGPKGLPALYERRSEIRALEKRNAALAQDLERRREHIRRLMDNPSEQELEIRERLKLVRPNEKVYIIGDTAGK